MGSRNIDVKSYEPLFGSWYVKEQVGEGSFSTVYLLERENLNSALKVITIPESQAEVLSLRSSSMNEKEIREYYRSFLDDLVQKMDLLYALNGSENIVSYEEHQIVERKDEIGWDILMRMEYLTPMVQLTADRFLEEREVIDFAIDICRALELCSEHGIIHRDIKPENIFVTESGTYKLGDFGLAGITSGSISNASRKGTYEYMAPEVLNRDKVGFRSDIYSLGLVMYKLLNRNRLPFSRPYPEKFSYVDREEAIRKRLNNSEEMMPPMNGSDDLKGIVLKACTYEKEDRFQSAKEMREALESLKK